MSDRISPVVLSALDQVVSDNGWLASSRPGPLRALLSDVLGSVADQHRAELDAVVVSAEEGVPTELRTAGRGTAQALVPELTQRLVAWGMADDLAAAVVESWASLVPEISRSAPVAGDSQTVISAPAAASSAPPAAPSPPAASRVGPTSAPEAAPAVPLVSDVAADMTAMPPSAQHPLGGAPPVSPVPEPGRVTPSRSKAWLAAAAAVAVVIVAGGWVGLRARGHHEDNPLLASLSAANAGYAKGLIPPGTCKTSTDHVVCTNPDSAISMLDVRTYPTKKALYQAYVAAVEKLRGAPLQVNVGDCNGHLRSGERSWNHEFQHPDTYSIQDHVAQDLTMGDAAQGRLACQVSGSYETILWTADSGMMLGEVQGPVMGVFPAWRLIHHGIVPPGAGPMGDMGPGSPSPSASDSSMGMG